MERQSSTHEGIAHLHAAFVGVRNIGRNVEVTSDGGYHHTHNKLSKGMATTDPGTGAERHHLLCHPIAECNKNGA